MLMVQSNAQPMKSARVKGPPPVPPRPNQSAVAEALAKTRKAVAESRANLRSYAKAPSETVKSLERTNSLGQVNLSSKQASPKQNGLARVKSFIRDVISDRGFSSDERRSSGHNSRRSSSDSSNIPLPTGTAHKKSNESLNSKAVKTCKQILVRSLSTSNKLEQEAKSKVLKSSSFVAKTVPLRKAPPPPLSPKPKLRPLRISRQSTVDSKRSPKQSPEVTPYVTPVDATPPCEVSAESGYATVEEVRDVSDRLRSTPEDSLAEVPSPEDGSPQRKNSLERKTSKVTEQLISEILASRNKKDAHIVIDKGKECEGSVEDTLPKDLSNHEMLIYELQSMRSQSSVGDAGLDDVEKCGSECSELNYARSSESSGIVDDDSDQAYAYILDDDLKSRLRKQYRAISSMSLEGLPPLPKSLSGFADAAEVPPLASATLPPADLRGQLDYLKQEMARLRQLDLSLLSELWSLSECMADWRRQLERAPRLRPAPPPPPPPFLRT